MNPWNRGGATPMIAYVWPSTVTVRPSTLALPPNRDRHQRSLMTATASSDGSGVRPTTGATPRSRKKFAETCSTSRARLRWRRRSRSSGDRGARSRRPRTTTWLCARDRIERPAARTAASGFLNPPGMTGTTWTCTSRSGLAHRQRAQQQTVDEAEERGVGADAERERERHDSGERRASSRASGPRIARPARARRAAAGPAARGATSRSGHRPAELQERFAPRVRVATARAGGLRRSAARDASSALRRTRGRAGLS